MQQILLTQCLYALGQLEGLSDDEEKTRIAGTLAMLEGIGPEDEMEGMLAVQMVATHAAAIECLRRVANSQLTLQGREQNLKHAEKLLSIYLRQIEVLDKHRGKGQQKVTVEYVNVESGGQAVVGHVESGSARKPAKRGSRSETKAVSQKMSDQPAGREGELAPTTPRDGPKEGDSK